MMICLVWSPASSELSEREQNPSWIGLERWYLGYRQEQLVKVYCQRGLHGLLLLLESRGQVERVFVRETWQDDFLRCRQAFCVDLVIFQDLQGHNVSLLAFRYHGKEILWYLSKMETWLSKGFRWDVIEEQLGLAVREMVEVKRFMEGDD
ncbi:hypothetical protein MUP77_19635 [Candidatus Bathyarchaeota archaeon]|nr:hypothetical protein [Candidatus Bathyarchaeota archaeon]